MAPAIPAPARDAAQEVGLGQSILQSAAELGAQVQQQRLAALRQHLHLKLADLEPLLARSEATMARRWIWWLLSGWSGWWR